MPFDLATFEAEVALKLIPTERLPSVAQDALEAGFDGPRVVRMAVLEPVADWGIDQALPPMMEELGCKTISPEDAALHLARQRARRILDTGEDPLPSMPYFYRLMLAADRLKELYELAYFDDDEIFYSDEPEEKRTRAREALEELLSPELRHKRRIERQATWELEQARIKTEWPYVLNSTSGRTLLQERYFEKIYEIRMIVWIEAAAWIGIGWAYSSWRTTVIGFIVSGAFVASSPLLGAYLGMRRERRDTLLRRGVPDDQI
jgi:hypothetical protein